MIGRLGIFLRALCISGRISTGKDIFLSSAEMPSLCTRARVLDLLPSLYPKSPATEDNSVVSRGDGVETELTDVDWTEEG
ncbi:hypothetical protein F4679DRAFT_528981 [Xylaria curta]|nr:hypothetical protein F4679DRAFT_528981 [Xylaria curta]